MDFIAIDFETATSELSSACSIGLAFVDGLKVIGSEYYLIKPPNLKFDERNIKINGITPESVQNSPDFSALWNRIKGHFCGHTVIVAHNASFDMSVLHGTLTYYSLPMPRFPYTCSIELSNKVCEGGISQSLSARADYFNIAMGTHHNAEDDAKTCAQIILSSIYKYDLFSLAGLMALTGVAPKDFAQLKPYNPFKSKKTFVGNKPSWSGTQYESLDIKSINSIPATKETQFTGLSYVLTGNFTHISKKQIGETMATWGATLKGSVSSKTNILIAGTQNADVVGEDGLSTKEKKAYDLIAAGYDILIMSEQDFIDIKRKIDAL